MVLTKETKNKMVYSEDVDEGSLAIIQTLYVDKWFAGEAKQIEVTVDTQLIQAGQITQLPPD